MVKVRKVDEFRVTDAQGGLHTIVVREPHYGADTNQPSGDLRYSLKGGGKVERVADDRFRIVESGEILTRSTEAT